MKRLITTLLVLFVAVAAFADRKPYTRNVAIVIYEDAEPLDWTGPYEVWHDAASFGEFHKEPAFNVYMVSKTDKPLSSQGMLVVPNYSIANAPKPDVLIVPGGNSSNITNDPEFFAWVAKAAREAELVQTVCTGAFVIAKAGLLDDLEVTTWYGAIGHLREQFPKVTVKDGRRFIDNGKILTTAGISAGIDGSLHAVARFLGREIANQVAQYMEYHWSPEPYLARDYKSLNPSTDDAGRVLQAALIKVHDKEYAEAARQLRAVIAQSPGETDAWRALATSLRETGDHAGSAEAFLKLVNEQHAGAWAYYNAAREYAAASQKAAAINNLKLALEKGYDRDAAAKDPAFAGIDIQQIATRQ